MLTNLKSSFCIFLVIIVFTAPVSSLPNSQEIAQIAFLDDHFFYLTQSKKHIGLISYQTQQPTMQQNLKQHETVLRFEAQQKYFVLRKQKDKALLFRLEKLSIEEINVPLIFQHHKIVDVLVKHEQIYILTNKDLQIYSKEQKETEQAAKNVLTSCRKSQWFMKCFERNGQIIIVLRKDQQLCVRLVNSGEKPKQKCLFNMSSEVTDIEFVKNGILVQTKTTNYLIGPSFQAESFQGMVTQVSKDFVTLSEDFRTFSVASKNFTAGINVVGSTQTDRYWIKENSNSEVELLFNDKAVEKLGSERPKRAWVHRLNSSLHLLVLQNQSKHLKYKHISHPETLEDQKEESNNEKGQQGSPNEL